MILKPKVPGRNCSWLGISQIVLLDVQIPGLETSSATGPVTMLLVTGMVEIVFPRMVPIVLLRVPILIFDLRPVRFVLLDVQTLG
jgi:hypothetical protein